jgi:hypothetical protein
LKKVTKELFNYLNSLPRVDDDNDIKVFKPMSGFKYDYERLFLEHECLVYKEKIIKLEYRFIRDNEHPHIKCIICLCGKRLVAKEVKEDKTMGCFCGLTYKLVKINNRYWDRTIKLIEP